MLMDGLMGRVEEMLKVRDKEVSGFSVDFEGRLGEYVGNGVDGEVGIG